MSEGSRDEVKEGVCMRECACVYVGGVQDLKTFGRLWFELRGKWGATSAS